MSEWSNVPAWKASIVKAIGGSNPLLSAKIPLSTSVVRGIFVKLKGEDSKGAPPKAEKVACGKFLATDRSVLQSITRVLLFALQNARKILSSPPKRKQAFLPVFFYRKDYNDNSFSVFARLIKSSTVVTGKAKFIPAAIFAPPTVTPQTSPLSLNTGPPEQP